MKKIYALLVVLTSYCAIGFGQATFSWIGPNGGEWKSAANWSRTSGSSTLNYPSTGDVANFTGNASVVFDSDIEIASLNVTNSAVVLLTGEGLPVFTITSPVSAINIASGSTLRLIGLDMLVDDDAKGTIAGTLSLETDADPDNFGGFRILSNAGRTTEINVSGRIVATADANSLETITDDYLRFNAGAVLELDVDRPVVPMAFYNPSSEVIISGVRANSVSFEEANSVGKVTYNSPDQEDDFTMGLPSGINIAGDLSIQNTNGKQLRLMSNIRAFEQTEWLLTIGGSLNISGSSKVVLAHADDYDKTYKATILGNLNAGGQSFSLQSSDEPLGLGTISPTIVYLQGNLNHTAGNFEILSLHTSESEHLYVVEMKGLGQQLISSHNGIFDNGSGQFTLRVNNAAGVVLSSSLQVGRVSFASASKGIINTNGNVLTLTNSTNNSLVLEAPAANGYIAGTVARATASTNELVFAVGTEDGYRPISILPVSNTNSIYQASFTSTPYADQSVIAPIQGVAPYYWTVTRISGADAQLKLSLPGQIANVLAEDSLMVVHYNGNDWVDIHQAGSILPGNASSGNIQSTVQSAFSLVSIGYALNVTLPIHLVSFTAKKAGNGAQLKWKVSDNSTPRSFEVLKSADGIQFSTIGAVSGLSGRVNYEYLDQSLSNGNNYYRLRMIDQDGSISYSPIVMVMNGTTGAMITSMLPTVVRDRARMNISSSENGKIQLVVTDMSGRIVHTQQANINSGNTELWLDATKLPSGIFQISGFVNGKTTGIFRFFKR